MLTESVKPTDTPAQAPQHRAEAKQFVDAVAIKVLAAQILKLRTRGTLTMGDLNPLQRAELLEDAAVALLGRDVAHHTPALYVAATEIRDLGELIPTARLELVSVLDRVYRTYRRVIAGERPDERRQMARLASADLQEGGK